jgi:hypothetical protein
MRQELLLEYPSVTRDEASGREEVLIAPPSRNVESVLATSVAKITNPNDTAI